MQESDSEDAVHYGRHNGHDSISNHQPHDCLLNRLFRCRSKKTSKLCVAGLCVGNSPESGKFPAQMASNAENVSIWWRHHGSYICHKLLHCSQLNTALHWGVMKHFTLTQIANPKTGEMGSIHSCYHSGLYTRLDRLEDSLHNNTSRLAPDSKVHGPTWSPPGSCWPQMGPTMAPWTLLSGHSSTSHVPYKNFQTHLIHTASDPQHSHSSQPIYHLHKPMCKKIASHLAWYPHMLDH